MEKTCPKCGLDRDINACLNMLKMWRGSGSAESLSVSVMKLGCQGLYADEVNPAELREEVKFFDSLEQLRDGTAGVMCLENLHMPCLGGILPFNFMKPFFRDVRLNLNFSKH